MLTTRDYVSISSQLLKCLLQVLSYMLSYSVSYGETLSGLEFGNKVTSRLY